VTSAEFSVCADCSERVRVFGEGQAVEEVLDLLCPSCAGRARVAMGLLKEKSP
jgi:DNA-directed RNA polymerase subunit RPC12/RpoP